MALNAWQKLTHVLPGLPFGDGADGDYSSATSPTMTARSCTGTSGVATLNLGSSGFSNGDVLKVVQTRGTNAGQWEIVKVLSGGGTSTLTLTKALHNTYQDSGSNQAQCIKIPRYRNCEVLTGTWTPAQWDGDTGGELIFAVRGTFTPTGSISLDGAGFRGGAGVEYNSTTDGYAGEGTAGASLLGEAANGNAGGGGELHYAVDAGTSGGGGGSNGSAGTNGSATNFTSAGQYGDAGATAGDQYLESMPFAGSGGGGTYKGSGSVSPGGDGAGNLTVFARRMVAPTGTISLKGLVGGNASSNDFASGSGGGAGGNALFLVGDAAIGTDKIRTDGGSYGTGTGSDGNHSSIGGTGGKGRIAIIYTNTLTGSVSSSYYGSYNATQDTTMQEFGGSAMVAGDYR